jgi:hypothetical protein
MTSQGYFIDKYETEDNIVWYVYTGESDDGLLLGNGLMKLKQPTFIEAMKLEPDFLNGVESDTILVFADMVLEVKENPQADKDLEEPTA